MCFCTLCTDRFLRSVDGSEVFRAFCRARQIPAGLPASARSREEAVERWVVAVSHLPEALREQVEREQAAVTELGSREGVAHLLHAAGGTGLPPDDVPDGGPLALWFLLFRPVVFWDVFFHHEHRAVDVWHAAKAPPGLQVPDVPRAARSLARALGVALRRRDRAERCCSTVAYRLPGGLCFAAWSAGRPVFVEEPTAGGEFLCRPVTAARCAYFAYYPQDGTVLLHAPPQPVSLVRDLLACFGRDVLGAPVQSEVASFALDRLKHPFHPLPDADDMEMIRVKTLALRYPERAGRRKVTIRSLTSDRPSAMAELLHAHAGADALADLRVAYAELQVRLRIEGRGKNHLIRLWPDRCDVGRGPVGDRMLACLRRWGL
jgi:hypothetical protein